MSDVNKLKNYGYLVLLFLVIGCQVNDSQNNELADLQAMFEEIETLAKSVVCENSDEWNFVSFGSKACGGPQGYIAYSGQINVENFFSDGKLIATF